MANLLFKSSAAFLILERFKESNTLELSQIAILVCSKVAAILLCKSASLQQIWNDKSESLKQVYANELVNTRQTCHKLEASNSLQTIAKTDYEDNLGFEPPTPRLIKLSS
ncbi:hypothetical protein AVEN_32067-1 [Araneus ventricosus]|uniref:Uncharacterized protein n=1 Tax=Araneus ventricosus TaxID=182803 RepID=A0A4Y2ED18_ARAVE|nr:hypothetical protein AVEN_32067-1 [Araneus ventricosus]